MLARILKADFLPTEGTVLPVQRFHWDSAEYAEAFATL
jgi:hypothetical protein